MYDDFDESDLDATEQEQDGESRDGDNNGWELLPEGEEEPVEDRSQGPEPVHIDNPRVVYLVARGGAAGRILLILLVNMLLLVMRWLAKQ